MRNRHGGATDKGHPTNNGHPASGGSLSRAVLHIDVGQDWRRCGADDGGCGVLLPITQHVCPRCGRVTREDLIPLDVRRLIPTHDGYELAVSVLRGVWRRPDAIPPKAPRGESPPPAPIAAPPMATISIS
jgi:hypothetical protein